MKKWSFLVRVSLIALITVTGSYAQNNTTNNSNNSNKGFYFRVGGGYITQTGKTEFNNADPNGITGIQQSTDISTDGSTIHVKALNGTMGAGYKFNVTGGYMFNKYLGAELGLNYFNGDKTRIGRFSSPVLMSDEQAYIRGLDIMPALYLTPGFKKVNPYARIGAIMTGAGKLYIETNAKQINGGGAGTDIVVNAKSEVKSDFSVGFAGAAGVTVPLNDKIDLFGEVEFKNF
ncbi:MAG: outer membrane beta-barrel protein [Flavobacteriaceae bacterium]|nr:outer membrane beta-barrel protein [Flavobacteriaceae bacterium]